MCWRASRSLRKTRTCHGSFSEPGPLAPLTPATNPVRTPSPLRGVYMQRSSYLFTSESVSEGHPDKVCDRISDEVVDAFFDLGPRHGWDARHVRVACETLATTNRVVIAGETRGPSAITKDYVSHLARLAIKDIGYEQAGFHWEKANIEVHLHAQSPNIAQGVDSTGNRDEGAGDQGIMFG